MDLAFIPFIPKDYFHWSSCAKFVGILSVFSSAILDCFEFTRLRFFTSREGKKLEIEVIFRSVLCLGEVAVVYQFTEFRSDDVTFLMGLLGTMDEC